MKTKLLSLIGLAAALVVAGCLSAPTAEQASVQRISDRPAVELRAAVKKAAEARGFHEREENIFERAELPPYAFFRFRLELSSKPGGTSMTAIGQTVVKNAADQDWVVHYVRSDSGYYAQIEALLDAAAVEALAKVP